MKTEWDAAVLFGGVGGATVGFEQGRGEYGGHVGRFNILCSIDVDPVACHNHDLITGSNTAVVMDLFDREQYIHFHGNEPPPGWAEVTAWDLWEAFQQRVPDMLFTSPPCKGFSGLLPEKSAKTQKYQALNRLTLRGLRLALEACLEYGGDLPSLILLENVPRILSRGKAILDQIKGLLRSYGYAVNDESHDCGELGGLGQHRKRYLLISRLERKMNSFVYRPPIKPLKTIGDVLSQLPMPGDTDEGGPLNRLPKLEWKTWLRLALIPAGGDWRDLEHCGWESLYIEHVPRRGAYRVADWDKTSRTVTGTAGPGRSNGVTAVADPRLQISGDAKSNLYRVMDYSEPAGCVTGAVGPSNGAACVGDPRLTEREGRHPGVYRIVRFDENSPCVTGTRFGSGAIAVSDPRIGCSPRAGTMGVQNWNEPSKTVIGSGDVHAGASAVADPRPFPADDERGVYRIIALDGTWHRPLTTFELGMLQGFPKYLPDGRPFQLEGCRDAKAREYIGNAVPPAAASAIGAVMLVALMASHVGDFMLSFDEVWVLPDEEKSPVLVS